MSRTCTVDLALDPAAPSAGRSLVRLLLRQWGVADADVHDEAALVVSELVTNALVHGGRTATLTLALVDDRVQVAVQDSSPLIPAPRASSVDDESGRGLEIVSMLALGWGVEPVPGGKRVFAELALAGAHCA